MIGHYLLSLTPEQEDRVLTWPFKRGADVWDQSSCLVTTALGGSAGGAVALGNHNPRSPRCVANTIAQRYDDLCDRFREKRVNAAIRNRILANRARRMLAPVSLETVGQPQS